MGRFFGPTPNVIASDGFFLGTAAPAAINWTGYGGALNIVSTGLYGGSDDGYWDTTYGGLTGAMGGNSVPIPANANISGAPVVALAFTQKDWVTTRNCVIVAVLGTIPQNAWNSISFVDSVGPVTYHTASAQAFSQTNPPGYSVWSFAAVNNFPFIGAAFPISVTVT